MEEGQSADEGEIAEDAEKNGNNQGAPQHLAHAGQPEELPAKSPPQAKIVKKKPLRFQFLYTNINFNLKSTEFELSKTRILSNTHMHTHNDTYTYAHTAVTT